MEVAPFFVDFHHFCRFSPFFINFHDLRTFVAIYALFPQICFGQNSLLRNITRFLHVWMSDKEDEEEKDKNGDDGDDEDEEKEDDDEEAARKGQREV